MRAANEELYRDTFDPEKFPLHNIWKDGTNFIVDLHTPGFTKDELDIAIENDIMTVTGNKASAVQYDSVYTGVVVPTLFTKSFRLADNILLDTVDYVDGILRIKLQKMVVEARQGKYHVGHKHGEAPEKKEDVEHKKVEVNKDDDEKPTTQVLVPDPMPPVVVATVEKNLANTAEPVVVLNPQDPDTIPADHAVVPVVTPEGQPNVAVVISQDDQKKLDDKGVDIVDVVTQVANAVPVVDVTVEPKKDDPLPTPDVTPEPVAVDQVSVEPVPAVEPAPVSTETQNQSAPVDVSNPVSDPVVEPVPVVVEPAVVEPTPAVEVKPDPIVVSEPVSVDPPVVSAPVEPTPVVEPVPAPVAEPVVSETSNPPVVDSSSSVQQPSEPVVEPVVPSPSESASVNTDPVAPEAPAIVDAPAPTVVVDPLPATSDTPVEPVKAEPTDPVIVNAAPADTNTVVKTEVVPLDPMPQIVSVELNPNPTNVDVPSIVLKDATVEVKDNATLSVVPTDAGKSDVVIAVDPVTQQVLDSKGIDPVVAVQNAVVAADVAPNLPDTSMPDANTVTVATPVAPVVTPDTVTQIVSVSKDANNIVVSDTSANVDPNAVLVPIVTPAGQPDIVAAVDPALHQEMTDAGVDVSKTLSDAMVKADVSVDTTVAAEVPTAPQMTTSDVNADTVTVDLTKVVANT